jgi:hypothetical protein
VTEEVRSRATALSAAMHEALELRAAATRADDFERAAAGLRERQRAITELVLDCLTGQQEVTERLLECLSGHDATIEELSKRVSALAGRVAALAGDLEPAADQSEAVSPVVAEPAAQAQLPEVQGNGAPPAAPKRRPIARLLGRAARACAVCRRAAPRKSKRELSKAGWKVSGHADVCPDCRAMGWRVGDAGGLPFRQRTVTEA